MLQERFDRLDANRDGELTRSELRRSADNASAKWGPQDEDAYLSESSEDDTRR
jgi:Ca2+-binding EF-hand superfamily protein